MTVVDDHGDPLAHGYIVDPEFNFNWEANELVEHVPAHDRLSLHWPVMVLRSAADTRGGKTKVPKDHFLLLSVL